MFRIITRVQLAYMGLFLVVSAGVVAYEAAYVWPVERCEAKGDWWDPQDHNCATPVPLWRITGRGPHTPSAKP
ncbi:MAG: hypothetical protein ACHP7N_10520 [Caulobacterales bacterium]